MKILLYEFKKICTRKTVLLCLSFILLHGILNVYYITGDNKDGISFLKIEQYYDEFRGKSANEALNELSHRNKILEIHSAMQVLDKNIIEELYPSDEIEQYLNSEAFYEFGDDLTDEYAILAYMEEKAISLSSYQELLTDINLTADRMLNSALYSEQDESARQKILATQQAYAKLEPLTLPFESDTAIQLMTSSPFSNWMLWIAVIFLSFLLFETDSACGMLSFSRCFIKGGSRTIICKFLVLFSCTLFLGVLFTFTNIGIAAFYTDFPDLDLPIQFSVTYLQCPFQWNIREFLIAHYLLKLGALLLYTLLVFVCFATFSSYHLVFSGLFIFLVLQQTLYSYLELYSEWGWLKQINLVRILTAQDMFQDYQASFLLGHTFSGLITVVFIIILCMLALTCFMTVIYRKSLPMRYSSKRFKKLVRKKRFIYRKRLFFYESFVALRINAGALILLLMCLLQAYVYRNMSYPMEVEDLYLQQYMEVLQGEWSPEKEAFLLAEQQQLIDAEQKINALKTQYGEKEIGESIYRAEIQPYLMILSKSSAIDILKDQLQFSKDNQVELLYQDGYYRIIGSNADNETILFTCIAGMGLILLSVPLGTYQYIYGVNILTTCTANGSSRIRKTQRLLMLFITFLVTLLSFAPHILFYNQNFDWSSLLYSVQSLSQLNLHTHISIFCFLLACIGLRFIGLSILSIGSLWIAKFFRNNALSFLIVAVLFLVPFFLINLYPECMIYFPLSNIQTGVFAARMLL